MAGGEDPVTLTRGERAILQLLSALGSLPIVFAVLYFTYTPTLIVWDGGWIEPPSGRPGERVVVSRSFYVDADALPVVISRRLVSANGKEVIEYDLGTVHREYGHGWHKQGRPLVIPDVPAGRWILANEITYRTVFGRPVTIRSPTLELRVLPALE